MPQCTTKRCVRCGVEKPLNEFHKHKGHADGLQSYCKPCTRTWHQDNAEQIRSYRAEYNQRQKPQRLAYNRLWVECNRERNAQYQRGYRKTNWARLYQRSRAWMKAHPHVAVRAAHRRRVRVRGNGGSYTQAEWVALCAKYGNCCLCCGGCKPLTVDHIIPVSKGGSNDISNMQPLCFECNLQKGVNIIDYRQRAIDSTVKQ